MYGASFFVYLNVAFYSVGLPTSYIQSHLDTYYDTLIGSKLTFRLRVFSALFCIIGILLLAPITEKNSMIFLSMCTGVCTWGAHGTVSSLATVVKCNSNTYQQIGFMLPGVFCIAMVFLMGLDSDALSDKTLYTYYGITAVCVFIGAVAWYVICASDLVRSSLETKDRDIGALILKEEISIHGLSNHPDLLKVMKKEATKTTPVYDQTESTNEPNPLMQYMESGRSSAASTSTTASNTIATSENSPHRLTALESEPTAQLDERITMVDYNRMTFRALMHNDVLQSALKG